MSSLCAAIEHGVILNDYVWDVDASTALPSFLCATPRRAALFSARAPHVAAKPIGPMTAYAAALVPRPTKPTRRVLLAFPSHSSHRVRAVFDAGAFADRLAEHGKRFDEVHVCVYWRDVESGLARVFAERGFTCVSAGHMFDPEFLPRLLQLLGKATAVVANEVGSSVLYAASAGVPVWLEKVRVDYVALSDVLAVDTPDHVEHANVLAIERLFAEPTDAISTEQRTFIADLVGAEHVLNRHQMAAVLDEAEQRYRESLTPTRRIRDAARWVQYLRARVRQEIQTRWR
ncbi:hypothetical protein BH11MYX2_BH11MYX2_30040 [soil metagenome]